MFTLSDGQKNALDAVFSVFVLVALYLLITEPWLDRAQCTQFQPIIDQIKNKEVCLTSCNVSYYPPGFVLNGSLGTWLNLTVNQSRTGSSLG